MSMRSYFGCSSCRQRKIKCDEARPVCKPCRKACRECSYSGAGVFRNFNLESQEAAPGLALQHEQPANEHRVWVNIPRKLTFVHITNPYEAAELQAPLELVQLHEPQTEPSQNTSSARVNIYASKEPLPTSNADISERLASGLSYATISPVYTKSTTLVPLSSPSLSEQYSTQKANATDPKILSLHLIRHFVDGPGQWMDLFDTGAYFSRRVPILTQTRSILRSAVCALAAKHVDRHFDTQGSRTSGFSLGPLDSIMASYDTPINWRYKSAEYYDEAINSLEAAIESYRYGEDTAQKASKYYPEDITAAVAILCMLELMDSPGEAWNIHLSALPFFSSTSGTTRLPFCVTRKALKAPIFWNLARQDYLSALINETQTRLSHQDMQLWQDAGLSIDKSGFLIPSSPSSTVEGEGYGGVEEDRIGNNMLWLVAKVVNYITSGDGLTPEDFARPAGQRMLFGVAQEELLRRWSLLEMEIHKWSSSLPPTFTPSARTPILQHKDHSSSASYLSRFEKTWYEIPMCAAIMQSYYMARILLLVNRPQESTAVRSTVSARLRSYRQTQEEVIRHGREICNISLADPPDPVRIHSVQPLFVAGQAFSDPDERQLVIKLLANIERDLGWGTSYHRNKLTEEWNADLEIFTIQPNVGPI
ncbi:hypothetical protein B0O99DRAFT_673216 [Bisporella sp. PMI_857]|nr:hypothetical protein B0O99DRAFT_673216 [Bisporella sp. PMI_857]